jgi:putative addiction module killer protein
MFEIVSYVDINGRSPFDDWFERLEPDAAVLVTMVLYRVSAGNLGDVRAVGEGVLERRLHHGPGYRIYFGRDGDRLIVLLAGGTKRRQSDDIASAQRAWSDYRARRRTSGTRPAEE